MDHLQSNIFLAGQRLNDLTGYTGIEALKHAIERQEAHAEETKQALGAAKAAYAGAIAQRSASQREVNELLQRKHAWGAADLERFTALYRSDHANERAEAEAREALARAERAAEEAAATLARTILARYHEEQIWSDKIRRMSTWGTWGLMGVNVLLFLIFQVAVEPWRRQRLVKGFEEKVQEALEREGLGQKHTTAVGTEGLAKLEPTKPAEPPLAESVDLAAVIDPEAPDRPILAEEAEIRTREATEAGKTQSLRRAWYICQDWIQDLFSDRSVNMRKFDLTATALEGALFGIAISSLVAAVIRGR